MINNCGNNIVIESIKSEKGYAKVTKQENLGNRVKLEITITPPPKATERTRYFLDTLTIKVKGITEPVTSKISGYYTRTLK